MMKSARRADRIVLDADPLTIFPEALLKTNVDLTIVGGKILYDRSQAP